MSYLNNIKDKIKSRDFVGLIQLWEEYCSDKVNGIELLKILKNIKNSEFAQLFGAHAEICLPLWEEIQEEELSYNILKNILDLQTTNSPKLAKYTNETLKKQYGNQESFKKNIYLIGLRERKNFQGAISKYELLNHLGKDKFVYHTGGWGTGEIIEISTIREQLIVEFDSIEGFKDISFKNALKNFIPLSSDHFYARRFGFPDELEKEARKNPRKVIKLLLRDLGPKSALEIKENICDWVIPQKDWSKWWQGVRTKLKKDSLIEVPTNTKGLFKLRKEELSNSKRLLLKLEETKDANSVILAIYKFLRDFNESSKSSEVQLTIKNKLEQLQKTTNSKTVQLPIYFLLSDLSIPDLPEEKELIQEIDDFLTIIDQIEIAAFKKRVLVLIKNHRTDWQNIFLSLILNITPNSLKDYLLKQLNNEKSIPLLKENLLKLINHPSEYPETFVWYFQKLFEQQEIPFNDKEGKSCFFESLFALMHTMERNNNRRDLLKKIHHLLCGNRYAIVRSIMADASIDFLQEILLLVTKSQTLRDHDVKIMHSLAKAVQPSLFEKDTFKQYQEHEEDNIIWTLQEGFLKIQDRIKQIAEKEILENAKEIEEARAFGDLKENAEFKAAMERRDRLQAELKLLSDQVNQCRILNKDDVSTEEVCVGAVVTLVEPQKETVTYTILGPWDANPDNNIISFQSKFAKIMIHKKKGESFNFQGQMFKIEKIKNYFDK